jgi:polyferredoxin
LKIGKVKLKPIQLLRTVTQILFFIFLPALYVSTFSGIKEIYLSIYQHKFSLLSLLPQIVEAMAILPVTVLLGRFFCGWMCAFGAMGDFIAMLSQKIFKRKFKINEKADRTLKYTKYFWLFLLIVTVWSFGSKAFSTSNPWDAFGMLLTPGSLPDFSYVATSLTPALILLLLIIGASFFVERFFGISARLARFSP